MVTTEAAERGGGALLHLLMEEEEAEGILASISQAMECHEAKLLWS